ncbi:MAG: hypothetical protein WD294_10510 [Phycisphaeraceae bacterium]
MNQVRRNNKMLGIKLAASALLVAYVLAFLVINTGNTADVWLLPFAGVHTMPTLLVILITAILSTLGWWLGAQLYRAWRRRRAQ